MKNEETILSEREKILARVREALKVAAPLPGWHGAGSATVFVFGGHH